MAREMILKTWCDVCIEDDIQTEAREMMPIAVGNKKSRIVALCKTHEEDYYAPFVDFLERFGQTQDALTSGKISPPKPATASRVELAAKVVCPHPDCEQALKNLNSLASHVRSQHQTNVGNILGKDGLLYDVEGNVVERGQPPATTREPASKREECDVDGCDVVYTWPEVANPKTTLGVHKAKRHGIPGQSKSVQQARAAAAAKAAS